MYTNPPPLIWRAAPISFRCFSLNEERSKGNTEPLLAPPPYFGEAHHETGAYETSKPKTPSILLFLE